MTALVTMPKYATYKKSGEDWLGMIPDDWSLLPVKQIFRLVVEPAEKNNNHVLLSIYTDIGVKPRAELEEKGNKASTTDGYWLVKKGDFIVNKLLAWMGAVGLSEYEGVTSPAYDVLRQKKEINGRFFHYLFRSSICISELKKHSKGIMDMRLRLYFDKFGAIKIPFPSVKYQNLIVDFLDQKTAQIDAAIAIKEQQIALLKERKQILIQQAVTQGLDPTVPMKDSGVEWIGEIPAHWDVLIMNYVIDAIGDVDHYMPQSIESGVPYVMTGDLKEFASSINFEDCKKVSHRNYQKLSKKIKSSKGDVILARYATIGTTSYIDIDVDFLVSYSCVTIKPNPLRLIGLYLFYYLKSDSFFQDVKNQVNTNTQGNVGIGDLKKVMIVLPPLTEQLEVAQFLKNKNDKFDELIALQQQQIEKLREYKTTLINSAVTGKIRVTPEMVEASA